MTEERLVRDRETNRVHRVTQDGVYVFPAANCTERAASYVILTQIEASDVSPDDLCSRCFTRGEA